MVSSGAVPLYGATPAGAVQFNSHPRRARTIARVAGVSLVVLVAVGCVVAALSFRTVPTIETQGIEVIPMPFSEQFADDSTYQQFPEQQQPLHREVQHLSGLARAIPPEPKWRSDGTDDNGVRTPDIQPGGYRDAPAETNEERRTHNDVGPEDGTADNTMASHFNPIVIKDMSNQPQVRPVNEHASDDATPKRNPVIIKDVSGGSEPERHPVVIKDVSGGGEPDRKPIVVKDVSGDNTESLKERLEEAVERVEETEDSLKDKIVRLNAVQDNLDAEKRRVLAAAQQQRQVAENQHQISKQQHHVGEQQRTVGQTQQEIAAEQEKMASKQRQLSERLSQAEKRLKQAAERANSQSSKRSYSGPSTDNMYPSPDYVPPPAGASATNVDEDSYPYADAAADSYPYTEESAGASGAKKHRMHVHIKVDHGKNIDIDFKGEHADKQVAGAEDLAQVPKSHSKH